MKWKFFNCQEETDAQVVVALGIDVKSLCSNFLCVPIAESFGISFLLAINRAKYIIIEKVDHRNQRYMPVITNKLINIYFFCPLKISFY